MIIKILKTKEKEKHLKSSLRNMTFLPIEEKQFELHWLSHQRPWRTKESATIFFKC